jgi:polygalacturonase
MKMFMHDVPLVAVVLAATAAFGVADHSLTEFPRLAGETDDAPRFQRAVDACYGGGLLAVPCGNYTLARTVFVTNLCSIEMSPGARIKAVAEMDWMFKINQMWQYNPKTAPKDVAVIRQDGGVLASQR